MDKIKLQEYYNNLSRIHDKFIEHEYDYKKGKNAKIREKAERYLKSAQMTFDIFVRNNPDLYKLLTSPNGNEIDDYSRAIIYDEIKSIRYFGNDIRDFLNKLKNMIDS